jgi:hypothetical protein
MLKHCKNIFYAEKSKNGETVLHAHFALQKRFSIWGKCF